MLVCTEWHDDRVHSVAYPLPIMNVESDDGIASYGRFHGAARTCTTRWAVRLMVRLTLTCTCFGINKHYSGRSPVGKRPF